MSKSTIKSITPMEFIMNSKPYSSNFVTYKNGTIMSEFMVLNNGKDRFIRIFDHPLTLKEIKNKDLVFEEKEHFKELWYQYEPNGDFQLSYTEEDKITKILKKYAKHIDTIYNYYFEEGDEEKLIEELINLIR